MKKSKRNFILTAILFVMFIAFTVCTKLIDVAPIGPDGSKVGFSTINGYFFKTLGQSDLWYSLTDAFGIVAILSAGVFALFGLFQLIKRKSLKKLDFDFYALAGFYILTGVCYVLFEKIIINYRPILVDGVLEASYPSSHTMLVTCFLCAAAIMIGRKLADQKPLRITLTTACAVIVILTVVGRLLSGVHWFTDIVGGVLLSATLLCALASALSVLDEK